MSRFKIKSAGAIRRAEAALALFANNRWRPYFYLFFGIVSASAILNSFTGYPRPQIHDEFAYLLAADTFANGRLTNPTPAHWEFFESFHIIMQPSYQAKYPPGQGLQLALGMVLGHPLHGVWLTAGLWAMAAFWALQALFTRSWALVGAYILSIQFSVLSYFSFSYWGGTLFGLAGTLILGGAFHLVKRAGIISALLMGTGVAIASLTRPMEGILFCIVPAVVFVRTWLSAVKLGDGIHFLCKVILPAAAVVALAFAFHLVYNHAVTGSFLVLPYQVYQQAYMPGFVNYIWQVPGPIAEQLHPVLEKFQEMYANIKPRSFTEYLDRVWKSESLLLSYLFAGAFAFAGLIGSFRIFSRDLPLRVANGCILALAAVIPLFSVNALGMIWQHYFAAWCISAVILILDGLRILWVKETGGIGWERYACTVLAVLVVMAWSVSAVKFMTDPYARRVTAFPLVHDTRYEFESMMKAMYHENGKRHLVFVKYSTDHNIHQEWVHNRANLETATVVWARYIDEISNERLLEYYADREVWLADISNAGHDVKISKMK